MGCSKAPLIYSQWFGHLNAVYLAGTEAATRSTHHSSMVPLSVDSARMSKVTITNSRLEFLRFLRGCRLAFHSVGFDDMKLGDGAAGGCGLVAITMLVIFSST